MKPCRSAHSGAGTRLGWEHVSPPEELPPAGTPGSRPCHGVGSAAGLDALSGREKDVFLLAAPGQGNAEIAAGLVLSEATVKSHVGSILAKLKLRNRIQLVAYAYENGLLNKKLFGLAVLAVGATAALAASTVPGGTITASGTPISGITAQAEAYASPDAAAEAGRTAAIRKCMAAAGYDYHPAPDFHAVGFNDFIGFKRLDVATARASGYASLRPAGRGEPAQGSTEAALFADPAFVAALRGARPENDMVRINGNGMGTSGGGCSGEGAKTIYGSMENYILATGVAGNSLNSAAGAAMSDSGFQKAIGSWKDCMSTSPYANFRSPADAVNAGVEAGGLDEFKIAVTDATCREQVGFHGQLDALLDKYLTTRMQQLEPEIAKVTEIRKQAAARAAELAAG